MLLFPFLGFNPHRDYELAVRSIAYLRQCTATDIRRKVTFHLVMDERHFPANLRKLHSAQGKVQTPPPPPPSNPASSTTAPPSDKRVVRVTPFIPSFPPPPLFSPTQSEKGKFASSLFSQGISNSNSRIEKVVSNCAKSEFHRFLDVSSIRRPYE